MLQKLISYFWWIEWEDSIKGPYKTKLAAGMMLQVLLSAGLQLPFQRFLFIKSSLMLHVLPLKAVRSSSCCLTTKQELNNDIKFT